MSKRVWPGCLSPRTCFFADGTASQELSPELKESAREDGALEAESSSNRFCCLASGASLLVTRAWLLLVFLATSSDALVIPCY